MYTKITKQCDYINKDLPANIVVFNSNSICVGCNFILQNIIREKKNLCVVSRKVRELDKAQIISSLNEIGFNYDILFEDNIYLNLESNFKNFPSSGGLIIISPDGQITYACSFKDPLFSLD